MPAAGGIEAGRGSYTGIAEKFGAGDVFGREGRDSVRDWLLEQLYDAYLQARKHKRATRDEHSFELNLMENLMILCDDIIERRYQPSRGVAFIIWKPVTREIFAAPFRDRVVHHFLYNQVYDWWDRRFIYDSYSCRVGKGALLGVQRMQKHMRQVSQMNTREAVAIKLDLRGYFMSLPRRRVFERVAWGLDQQFGNERKWLKRILRFLWRQVIFDDPIRDVRIRGRQKDWDDLPRDKSLFYQPPGQGVVIGNLSSQLISNIYLDQLDRFVKFELGYKHYGRYVDDFFLIVTKEELPRALADVEKINDFLRELGLTLHPRKRYIQDVRKGVPFLGAVVYPWAITPARRIKGNFYRALVEYEKGMRDESSIISYIGHTKHIQGKKMCRRLFAKTGFDPEELSCWDKIGGGMR